MNVLSGVKPRAYTHLLVHATRFLTAETTVLEKSREIGRQRRVTSRAAGKKTGEKLYSPSPRPSPSPTPLARIPANRHRQFPGLTKRAQVEALVN